MVISNSQSKLRSVPLDLSLENLSIKSTTENLGASDEDVLHMKSATEELATSDEDIFLDSLSTEDVLNMKSVTEELATSDEDIFLDSLSTLESEEDTQKAAHKSPFEVWYIRDEVWPSRVCTRKHGCDTGDGLRDSNSCKESSNFDTSSPASPIDTPSHKKRDSRLSPLAMRESLLEEAWQRKRKLYLKHQLANLKERSSIRMLGRSSSECGKPMRDNCNHAKHEVMQRSMSDCGKPNKDPLITPTRLRRTRTRKLTDDDFEELKGCLDLGFRFDQSSIPNLCETLPALEAVHAVTQNFQELTASPAQSSIPSLIPSWRITSPGDDPEEVKENLRHWAQAVACSARLFATKHSSDGNLQQCM